MRTYLEKELPDVIASDFPVDMTRQAIMGHSMGGYGALTIALRNPEQLQSVSAFSPIVSLMHCPWGEKALTGYLGEDRTTCRHYDACALIEGGHRFPDTLIDHGTADNFLESQLQTHLLQAARKKAGQSLTVRIQEGYDHSHYFISTFMEDHLRYHADRLSNKQAK